MNDRAICIAGTTSRKTARIWLWPFVCPWGERKHVKGQYAVIPAEIEVGSEHLELASLLAARDQTWSPELTRKLQARLAERMRLFESEVRNAYLDAKLAPPNGTLEPVPRVDGSFSTWVDACIISILKRMHPSFETYAPVYGALPKEAYRALMRFASEHDFGDPTSDEFVQIVSRCLLGPDEADASSRSQLCFRQAPRSKRIGARGAQPD